MLKAGKLIGAGLAIIGLGDAAIGVGFFAAYISGISRNPAFKAELFNITIGLSINFMASVILFSTLSFFKGFIICLVYLIIISFYLLFSIIAFSLYIYSILS